jgi:hypothetical protein
MLHGFGSFPGSPWSFRALPSLPDWSRCRYLIRPPSSGSAVLELEKPQISKTGVCPRIRKRESKEEPQPPTTGSCAMLASGIQSPKVQLGAQDGLNIEVAEGLSEGDMLVY